MVSKFELKLFANSFKFDGECTQLNNK